jgi:chromosome segregation ATPase
MNRSSGTPHSYGSSRREDDYFIGGKKGHYTNRSNKRGNVKRSCSRGRGRGRGSFPHASTGYSSLNKTDLRVDQVGSNTFFDQYCPTEPISRHPSGEFTSPSAYDGGYHQACPRDPRIPPSGMSAIQCIQTPSSSSLDLREEVGEVLQTVTSSSSQPSRESIDHQEEDDDSKKTIAQLDRELQRLLEIENLLSKQVDLTKAAGKSPQEIADSYVEFLKASRQRQKVEIKFRCEHYKDLKKSLSSANHEKDELASLNRDLNARVISLEGKLTETQETLETLTGENSSLSEQIGILTADVREHLSKIEMSSGLIARLQEENAQVKDEIREKTSEIERLEKELNHSEEQFSREHASLISVSAEFQIEKVEAQNLSRKSDELKALVTEKQTTIESLKQARTEDSQKFQILAANLEKKTIETEKLSGKKAELESLFSQNQRTIQSLKDELSEATRRYQATTTALAGLSQQLQMLIPTP